MRVVDAIAKWFEEAGITHYFGYAGGAVWPFMDALVDYPQIEGIQAKHESHAVHMADVYYRATGRVAPVLVTKGPGLMNTVGGVASAMHDSAAVVVLAGAGSTHLLGKGGMQEMYYKGFEDAVSVFRPITKGAWMVVRPDTVLDVLNMAYKTAVGGRPGPVLVQIPFDVQLAPVEAGPDGIEAPSTRVASARARPDGSSMARVAELVERAERPVIVAGGGCRLSPGAPESLRQVAEQLRVPVATSLTAKGVLPEDHPLSLGCVGRSGTDMAAKATRAADLIVAVGARFSDNHTSNWRKGLIYEFPRTHLVHVDADANEIGRNYPVDVGIVGDAATFLDELTGIAKGVGGKWERWLGEVDEARVEWREKIASILTAPNDPIHPGRLSYEVGEALGPNGRVLVDVGDVIQYAEPYMTIRRPDSWFINAGMAEMTWASTGVLGAVAADPERPAVVITGDGAFNMCSQILATAVEYQLPAIWVILNNHELGIERKGAEKAFSRNHPWTRFVRKDTGEAYNPDYVRLAEANGAMGERLGHADDFAPALARAIDSRQPYVLDVPIDLTIPTFFTEGIDRAYPAQWGSSYPQHSSLRVAEPSP
jgi:acetolactate synthase I/II/III large subunit